jgi:pyruvate,water dikinase
MLRELGGRLEAAGAFAEADDVFWLEWEELRGVAAALDAGDAIGDWRPSVAERRAAWLRERAITPPVALPLKAGMRFLGIDWSSAAPARANQDSGAVIKGVGASPGRVAGTARVLLGPGEFDQMHPGEILVAKITTPAWTPLFALAGGVVTDVGGPLSHGSIVAREYRIPAVLGTGVATARLRSGQRVVVDGDKGTVTLEGVVAPGQTARAPEKGDGRRRRRWAAALPALLVLALVALLGLGRLWARRAPPRR